MHSLLADTCYNTNIFRPIDTARSRIKQTPKKIEKKGQLYVFPYGNLSIVLAHTNYLDVTFDYKKENWKKIDEIMNHLAKIFLFTWEIISYLLEKKFSITKLLKKCKETEFKIVSYKPIKGEEVLKVDTSSWLGTTTTFKNEEHEASKIIIKTDHYFRSDFYSFLSHENIIEFIKDCLE